MLHQISFRSYLLLIFTLAAGLGFALLLPWLANQQVLAVGEPTNDPKNLAELTPSSEKFSVPNLESSNIPFGPPPDLCFATHNNGDVVFSSFNGSAVQQAVDDAPVGSIVKVAGNCWWVESRAGLTQTIYISKTLTLQGGYKNDEWEIDPDP